MWAFIDVIVFGIQSFGFFVFILIFAEQLCVPASSEKLLEMHITVVANQSFRVHMETSGVCSHSSLLPLISFTPSKVLFGKKQLTLITSPCNVSRQVTVAWPRQVTSWQQCPSPLEASSFLSSISVQGMSCLKRQ